ncbi:Nuclear Hormone Receptor family [Caenorhabditis elegans]|uniref:Nuclear Hormone Receptor family n=1 Tax=Caenorhabditis elegans TaxID=6239 RepID=O16442_CAEEL|nr:Nuclear Hormone Receptor family [Caenorhabditis elegans]CCD62996.1 Nuclear Hormone Receptor family [Caenorhabditis elegans]|eukprot:NP_504933.2 Nuclear Hormone Receptor family [Caenorhabditis elegans]
MFFRRAIVENPFFNCKKLNNCYEVSTNSNHLKCAACRFKRCLQLGMKLPPSNNAILELENQKAHKLKKLLNGLILRDAKRCERHLTFYTRSDPSLEDILINKKTMNNDKNENAVTSFEWSFLAVFNVIEYFSTFDFIENLEYSDKKLLFQCNTFNANVLCGAMRGFKEKRSKMVTPTGQAILPDGIAPLLNTTSQMLHRVSCQVIAIIIELKMTNEEFILLNLIFFLRIDNNLSESAKISLASHQNFFTNALFEYCQLKYERRAPSRFADLLSLCQIIQKTSSEMKYIGIMLQTFVPGFRAKTLVSDAYMI